VAYDLKGCSDCLLCSNLRQKKYCILNQQYSKEEYFEKIKDWDFSTHQWQQAGKTQWEKVISQAHHKYAQILNSENCTGDNITNSKNTHQSFNVGDCEDSKFCYDVLEAKNCYDLNYSLYKPEMACELISTLNLKYSAYCMASHHSHEIFYCDMCNNSSQLFGCVGLRQKQYCILNKQYSKEDYYALLKRIIDHMVKTGEWGEFFPSEMSPFEYHETVTQEYFPQPQTDTSDTVQSKTKCLDLVDIGADILQQKLICAQTGKAFRLQPMELDFYKKMNLPIPRFHPSVRHTHRDKLRNPRQLYDRPCHSCQTSLKTTFAPDRKEEVLCEECYLGVVI